jgi:drug/metabolite transporter (DMT)-like permease
MVRFLHLVLKANGSMRHTLLNISGLSRQRQGEASVVLLTLIEAWFPILSLQLVADLGPLSSYALAALLAASVFVCLLGVQGRVHCLWQGKARFDLWMTAFWITLLFTLVFWGLQTTTAGNMAVILFLQVLFAYLYFHVLGRQPMSFGHSLGAFLMTLGAVFVLFPENFRLNSGDGLVLLAALIAPLANYHQQRARRHVDSITLLGFRNLVAFPVLFVLASIVEGLPSWEALAAHWLSLLLLGVGIFGFSKWLWVEALHRISITKTSALASLTPVFTLVFAYFWLNESPSLQQCLGVIPILLGGILITRPLKGSVLAMTSFQSGQQKPR